MSDDPTAGEAVTPVPAPSTLASAVLPCGVEADQIRNEVERIVVSPAFRTSKRNCNLLRHIVDCALSGNFTDLKERRIGADVFGRPADYDTNSDHIVRSVAGEVRRRLAQYYMQSGSGSGIRIDLLAGSYVPQFRPANEQPGSAIPAAPVPQPVAVEPPAGIRRWRMVAIAVAVVCCALAVAIWTVGRAGNRLTPLERFWQPMYSSSSPVLLCVPGVVPDRMPPRPNSRKR